MNRKNKAKLKVVGIFVWDCFLLLMMAFGCFFVGFILAVLGEVVFRMI